MDVPSSISCAYESYALSTISAEEPLCPQAAQIVSLALAQFFGGQITKPTHTRLDKEPLTEDNDTDASPSVKVTAPTIDDLPTPEAIESNEESEKQVTHIETDLQTLEEELGKKHEYTADDFQAIEMNPDHPNG
jgi:hypothetical protein